MEGVNSCVSGRPCRTRDHTRPSIKIAKENNDVMVTKALSHTILTYSKEDSQPSCDLHKQGLLTPPQ